MTVISAISAAVQAIAEASKRDPVAQRLAAERRSASHESRSRSRWLRSVRQTTERLSAADRRNDLEAMVAAILQLQSLGIDLAEIEKAQALATRLASD